MASKLSLSRVSGVLLLALCAALAYGQVNLATVTGVVTDSAEAVIPTVEITIRNV